MVCRDAEDEDWSFLTGEAIDMSEALLVTLGSMIERDRSLLDLADLLPGWTAVRTAFLSPWERVQDAPPGNDQGGYRPTADPDLRPPIPGYTDEPTSHPRTHERSLCDDRRREGGLDQPR